MVLGLSQVFCLLLLVLGRGELALPEERLNSQIPSHTLWILYPKGMTFIYVHHGEAMDNDFCP